MKSALALVLLAATTASLGCGGGAVSVPSTKLPVVQTPSPQPPPACNPPNTIIAGVCTAPPPAPSPQPPPPAPNPNPTPVPVTPSKHYTITDLAQLPGNVAAQAQAISNGHVVGWSILNSVTHATLWEGGVAEDLGLGVAYAVNSTGQTVGYAPEGNGIFHATFWDHGTTYDLLTLAGFDSSLASGINDSGTIVGVSFSSQNTANQAAFKWTQQTGMQAIEGAASVSGISANGDIAGMTTDSRAAIFTASGTTIALGTLGDFSLAGAVNNQGHACGMSPLVAGGQVHAFFYNGTTMQDIGTLQTGSNTVAPSINDSDLIVGSSNLAGHALPYVWSATTGMEDLNGLISNESGWLLVTASGIDSVGEISGAGQIVSGEIHGYLLTPEN
jgi:probable HAF family extracellular repeat protein